MIPYIKWPFNFSGLTPMFKKAGFLFICFFVLLHFQTGCGIGVGNGIWGDPTTPGFGSGKPNDQGGKGNPPPKDAEFQEPIDEYYSSGDATCGEFTENNTLEQVDAGRECIINADIHCVPSRYLFNKTNSDGTRFVSYVSVVFDGTSHSSCLIQVHTVSNVPPLILGNQTRICSEFNNNEIPEVACGILEE